MLVKMNIALDVGEQDSAVDAFESLQNQIRSMDIEDVIKIADYGIEGELEPEQFDCCMKCPKCGEEQQVDWQCSEHDGEIMRQGGSCGKCGCEFTETSEIKYLYTEID